MPHGTPCTAPTSILRAMNSVSDDISEASAMHSGRQCALISGITGQDGCYLTELLLAKGYEVHGIIRRASTFNTDRIDHLYTDPHNTNARMILHYGDLSDGPGLRRILEEVQPHEIYNLGAQSHVAVSFHQPEYTADIDGLGTLRLLEAIRDYQHRTGTTTCATTRPAPARCSAAAPHPRTNRPRSIRRAPTPPPKSWPTTSSSTTAKPTASTPATASSSTTNPNAAAKPSSPAKSPAPQHASG